MNYSHRWGGGTLSPILLQPGTTDKAWEDLFNWKSKQIWLEKTDEELWGSISGSNLAEEIFELPNCFDTETPGKVSSFHVLNSQNVSLEPFTGLGTLFSRKNETRVLENFSVILF